MTDIRFTTVVDNVEELLSVVDVDEIDDFETLLMFLLARPVGVAEVWEDDDQESALEVAIHGNDGVTATIFEFPTSVIDLARSCAQAADHLGPYTKGDSAEAEATAIATLDDAGLIAALQNALGQVRLYNMSRVAEDEPWVADLKHPDAKGECQSTIGFDDYLCVGSADRYVQLEILEYSVANPRWEGKLCRSCLAGWQQWAADEPDAIRVLSVDRVVSGE